MYNLQGLITRVGTVTGYATDWAKSKEMDLSNSLAPPEIKIGYRSVESTGTLGDGETPDPYQYFEEDLTQGFIVMFSCRVVELHIIWRNLYNCISGWIPPDLEADHSGIFYSGGGASGLQNGRIWWTDHWRMDFPRL